MLHLSSWYGAAQVRLVTEVLVNQVILAAHQDTTGTITTTWHYNSERGVKEKNYSERGVKEERSGGGGGGVKMTSDKMVGGVFQRFAVLADHMVEAQVQLIERQHLSVWAQG